jgi:hypothetical protein
MRYTKNSQPSKYLSVLKVLYSLVLNKLDTTKRHNILVQILLKVLYLFKLKVTNKERKTNLKTQILPQSPILYYNNINILNIRIQL